MLTVDLERLGLRAGDWLLDAGCGGGRHAFGALDRGANVVGLDLDMEGLQLARAGVNERRGQATEKLHGGVLQGDVFRLPFPDGSFDRIVCSEVMEHVHDYAAAIRELVRVVRLGGTVGGFRTEPSRKYAFTGKSVRRSAALRHDRVIRRRTTKSRTRESRLKSPEHSECF